MEFTSSLFAGKPLLPSSFSALKLNSRYFKSCVLRTLIMVSTDLCVCVHEPTRSSSSLLEIIRCGPKMHYFLFESTDDGKQIFCERDSTF